MTVYRSPKTGRPVSRAGVPYALLWTVIVGARAAFSYGSAHWFQHSIVSWAIANQVTEAAITDGLIFMAVAMVLVRTLGLRVRASRPARPGSRRPAGRQRLSRRRRRRLLPQTQGPRPSAEGLAAVQVHRQRREDRQHGGRPADHGQFRVLHRPGVHAAAGSGLPNRCRQAAASADIGFQLAMGCSQPGMPWVGTNAPEMKVSGRKIRNPVGWAASGLRRARPRQMPAQVKA